MTMTTTAWELVYTVVSPLAATFTGPWRRYRMEFRSSEPMAPEEWVDTAMDLIEADGRLVVLSGGLWKLEEDPDVTDHWYLDVTLALNPAVYPATVEPSFAWALIPGILWGITGLVGVGGIIGAIFTKDSDSGGGIGGTLSAIMPLMIMMMMMSMMMPMMSAGARRY